MNDFNSQMDNQTGTAGADDELVHDVPVVVADEDGEDDPEPGAGRAPIDLDGAFDMSDLSALLAKATGGAKKDAKPAPHTAAKADPGADSKVEAELVDPANVPQPGISAEREQELLAVVEAEKNNTLRAIADLHNLRRRSEEERRRLVGVANERLIKDAILPIIDDFERSLAAAKQTESYEQLVNGVEAVARKIIDMLAKEGVEPIPTVGEKFDPDYHDAVMVDEDSAEPDETITEEFRKGYTMHQRVIRPALVKVAKS